MPSFKSSGSAQSNAIGWIRSVIYGIGLGLILSLCADALHSVRADDAEYNLYESPDDDIECIQSRTRPSEIPPA
jgi:hypothetical protein